MDNHHDHADLENRIWTLENIVRGLERDLDRVRDRAVRAESAIEAHISYEHH